MRVGAQWIDGKEFPNGNEPGWVGVGFLVSDAGRAAPADRRDPARCPARSACCCAVPVLAAIYVVALGVAWVAMSGKP